MLCAENAAVSHGQSLGQNSGPPGEDGGGADGAAALLAFLPVDVPSACSHELPLALLRASHRRTCAIMPMAGERRDGGALNLR